MYFIVNNTSNEIVIGDLGHSLGPKKSIDLEKFYNRDDIERSQDLKRSISQGIVTVRHNSGSAQQTETQQGEDKDYNNEIKMITDAVTSGVMSKMESLIKEINQQKSDNKDVVDAIKDLASIVSKQSAQQVVIHQQGEASSTNSVSNFSDEDSLDDETLAELHAKSMKKVEGSSEGNIQHEKVIKRETISDQVSDLENLLG